MQGLDSSYDFPFSLDLDYFDIFSNLGSRDHMEKLRK